MTAQIPLTFDNTYVKLPDRFFTLQPPTAPVDPKLIITNEQLAKSLNIGPAWLAGSQALAMFSGTNPPPGSEPLAQVYAGHQFGGWSQQLGDGRALLLGEVVDTTGKRRDIQLKGSGRTPYSRGGDGKAWLGPVLREYLVSEAMHALNIPTTRALAVVATGENVQRETARPGAVLTRVASSHIRVGTFQYFAARQDTDALEILTDHVINRHYPEARSPLQLLDAVISHQACLIAKWMSVGFIHGVMNTDNMAISGETIDYGPCAFMDQFHPDTVFSSIDQHGRYAYSNQPDIAVWNLAKFASCLLPLMGDEDAAVQAATASLNKFPAIFESQREQAFLRKIGITHPRKGDAKLVAGFLHGLAATGTDFTNGFRDLSDHKAPTAMQDWRSEWLARLELETEDPVKTMTDTNPAYIPRNHRIEAIIKAAVSGDYQPFYELNNTLKTPYCEHTGFEHYRLPPKPEEIVRQTFCGT
ncbi:MAG: YdiU family protein [Paracoccaceae bacterium]